MAINVRQNVPSFIRAALNNARPVQLTFSDVQNTNIKSTSSFFYDPSGSPLKSTQQVNVDWSKFENHTFFMSAEAKVTAAMDQVINGFPFDGTRTELERFLEGLSGFERWVFDSFPKYRGELLFSSSYVAVKDHVGSLFPDISRAPTGESVLTPNGGASMTLEMHLRLPEEANDRQVVLQKLGSPSLGFAVHVEPSVSSELAEVKFMVVSGSTVLTTSGSVSKGRSEHLSFILDRTTSVHVLETYVNAEHVNSSRKGAFVGDMPIEVSDLIIGSGSTITLGQSSLTPVTSLSGTLDEFRLFHSRRTPGQIVEYTRKSVYADDDLKLYYKFNEPAPPLVDDTSPLNAIILDSSGNSLHSLITNFTGSLRINVDDQLTRMTYERDEMSPVLFTGHPDIVSLNNELLSSASYYDQINPNLITKLVPRHYLHDGQALEGFRTSTGDLNQALTSTLPRLGRSGSTQLIVSFLYIYARFFDDIKIFIDAFKNVRSVDYDLNETVPDNFLLEFVDQFGFTLPPLFNDSTVAQYVNAENIDPGSNVSEHPLRYVQNQLMRRVLVNLPDVLRSKGTQHSIKSFLRSIGIDPDNTVRLREKGGSTKRSLSFGRELKREVSTMVKFSTSSLALSSFLSSSRTEVGFPEPAGNFVKREIFGPHGVSDDQNDGLLTSGSWTVESIVKWRPVDRMTMTSATQSIVRIAVSGTNDTFGGTVANLTAVSSSTDPRLVLWVRAGVSASSPVLRMELPMTSGSMFDGNKWNVSFGCTRNDRINSNVSSSYFVRLATQNNGEIESYDVTSSFFNERSNDTDVNVLRSLHSTFNTSGSFLVVGNQIIVSAETTLTGARFLNDEDVDDGARAGSFNGLMSNLRFWSKDLSEQEWLEHVKNPGSRGVEDPLVNFNFVTDRTGSFERLRLESLMKQGSRDDSNGTLTFVDFSQNENHVLGSGFTSSSFIAEFFDRNFPTTQFDEATTDEKIRARSFIDINSVVNGGYAQLAPVHEIVKSEEPTDDTRFSMDFSLIDSLNRDIVTMFSSLDSIGNAIGSPELQFTGNYPDMERLSTIYFNRISTKLDYEAFLNFFRWFDSSVGVFIEQLVPRKTLFKGVNFTVESHMLERHKIRYHHEESYLTEDLRSRINDVLLLQLIDGSLRRF